MQFYNTTTILPSNAVSHVFIRISNIHNSVAYSNKKNGVTLQVQNQDLKNVGAEL